MYYFGIGSFCIFCPKIVSFYFLLLPCRWVSSFFWCPVWKKNSANEQCVKAAAGIYYNVKRSPDSKILKVNYTVPTLPHPKRKLLLIILRGHSLLLKIYHYYVNKCSNVLRVTVPRTSSNKLYLLFYLLCIVPW